MPVVKIDDAVRAGEKSARRTDSHAGRVFTVVATQDGEIAPDIGKCSLFDMLHPRAKVSQGNFMLRFASHGAGVTAYAAAVVDDKSVLHEFRSGVLERTGDASQERNRSLYGAEAKFNPPCGIADYGFRIAD